MMGRKREITESERDQLHEYADEHPEFIRWLQHASIVLWANLESVRSDDAREMLDHLAASQRTARDGGIHLANLVLTHHRDMISGPASPVGTAVEKMIQRSMTPGEQFCFRMRMAALRESLDYECSSQEERHFIDRIILCETRHAEVVAGHTKCFDGRPSQRQARYWDQRLSAAERSLDRAHDALIKLRRFFGLRRMDNKNRYPPLDPRQFRVRGPTSDSDENAECGAPTPPRLECRPPE